MKPSKVLRFLLAAMSCALFAPSVCATPAAALVPSLVATAGVFGDNMVLQRQIPVPVWGTAAPGATVTVNFMGRTKSAAADASGKWSVLLDSMEAMSLPQQMTVTDGTLTQTIRNILVGEVWLCSGQSNMEFPVKTSNNAQGETAAATDSLIRHIKVPVRTLSKPGTSLVAPWMVCSPTTVGDFTACGYFMAKQLRRELGVPIGLINATLGGSKIEAWTPAEGYSLYDRSIPALNALRTDVEKTLAAMARGATTPKPFASRLEPKLHQTTLYNGMIHPVAGYAIRGATWYQGEANRKDGWIYTEKMKALVASWRGIWGIGDFPFYFVQITPYRYPVFNPDKNGDADATMLARLWAAQSAAEVAIPNSGMVVTNDIGDVNDAHPRNKQEVGRRLSLLALHYTYGRTDLRCHGPIFRSAAVEGNGIRVSFDHAAGLKSRNGLALSWFDVCGADGIWVKADAVIDGETLLVSAPTVPSPVFVRFAWNKVAVPNLANGANLPAAAFNTRPDGK